MLLQAPTKTLICGAPNIDYALIVVQQIDADLGSEINAF